MKKCDSLEFLADQAIAAYHMLEDTQLVLVGLSGGADSVALTHYLRFGLGVQTAACHINHNLRGRESERDEAFVRQLCAQWGIPLFVESADVAGFAKEKNLSLEEAGREIRYRFFEKVRRSCWAQKVATAHTASDNLETLLLNLTRGTARKGLCGIPPVRSLPVEEGMPPLRGQQPESQMIRPLLFCPREQVEDYCRRHGLSYVIDSSNAQVQYSRNRIRHRVIPVLVEMNPGVVSSAARATAVLREEEEFLDHLARERLTRCVIEGDLLCAPLLQESRPLQRRMAAAYLEKQGVRLSGELLDEILSMAERGRGKRMISSGTYLLVRSGRIFLEIPPEPAAYFETVWKDLWPASAVVPGGKLTGTLCEISEKEFSPNPGNFPGNVQKKLLYLALDYDKIKGTVTIRQRHSGDSIALVGRGGTKTLKKLLIDYKMTAYEKSTLPVLADEEGLIAVWGFGPDRRTAPGPDTRRILRVEWQPDEDWSEET